MAKCPKCGGEITFLNLYVKAENKYHYCLDKYGEPLRLFWAHLDEEEEEDYECPHCGESLTKNEEEAETILKGGGKSEDGRRADGIEELSSNNKCVDKLSDGKEEISMPNWCMNKLTVSGEKEDLEALKSFVEGEDTRLSLQKIDPTPQRLLEMPSPIRDAAVEKENIDQFGARDWYDWNVQHWGTKWDVHADLWETEGNLVYEFDSAWSPPEEAMRTLSRKFPNLKLKLFFFEPGMGFGGEISFMGGEESGFWKEGKELENWLKVYDKELHDNWFDGGEG